MHCIVWPLELQVGRQASVNQMKFRVIVMYDIFMMVFRHCFSGTCHFRRTLLNSTTVLFDKLKVAN